MNLLDQIKAEINKAGGRTRMGYVITNKEAPEWFDRKTRQHFKWQMASLMNKLHVNLVNRSESRWTQEQIDYLRDNWKRFHIEYISASIGKTVHATRAKARVIMTPEQYKNRFYNREQAAVVYREKSKNWKRYKK